MAKRLCLVDDLKMLKITMSNTSSRNKLNPEVNDHYNIFSRESQEYELKTKDEAYPEDEEDTRSSQEYMNDLKEEYQARALLAKPKRFFKKEEVSFNDNEVTEVKALMTLADEERVSIGKESARNGEWIKISMKKSLADNSEVSITGSNKPKLSETEDSTLSNHDSGKHPLLPQEKLTGAKPVSGPKTIKSILKSNSTFKAKTLKGIIINEPSSAPARGNKSSLASKTNSTLAGKLKNVKMEDDPPLAILMKELNELKLQISRNKSSYFRNKNSQQYSKRSSFALKGNSDSDCAGCNMDRKSTSAEAEDVVAAGCCADIL
ncbi:hypothetical protein Tco_1317750 [Tanacetum coccineum]